MKNSKNSTILGTMRRLVAAHCGIPHRWGYTDIETDRSRRKTDRQMGIYRHRDRQNNMKAEKWADGQKWIYRHRDRPKEDR